jgi:hypothetical protein
LSSAIKTPAAAFVVIATGMELGLSPMQALRGIYIVQGKPVLSSDLLVALVKRSPVCLFFRLIESTGERATYETHRKGEPEPTALTWTADDAKRAGLLSKDSWRAHPAAMLRARCAAALARAVYPDLLLGVYEESEGEEISARVSPPKQQAKPAPGGVVIDAKTGEVIDQTPTSDYLDRARGATAEADLDALKADVLAAVKAGTLTKAQAKEIGEASQAKRMALRHAAETAPKQEQPAGAEEAPPAF